MPECMQAAGGGRSGGRLPDPQGRHGCDVPPHHVQLGGLYL
jgi:hypothetical protein